MKSYTEDKDMVSRMLFRQPYKKLVSEDRLTVNKQVTLAKEKYLPKEREFIDRLTGKKEGDWYRRK